MVLGMYTNEIFKDRIDAIKQTFQIDTELQLSLGIFFKIQKSIEIRRDFLDFDKSK